MSQITKLSISILKVHPQNQEFFDDIEGEQYERFKKSIKEDGIITPLIVSPDMTIISGHQRYKASKDLGIDLLPVIIREDLTDEDEQLKKLLATNFGRLKNNPVKQGRVYEQYEKLCGVRQGSAGSSDQKVFGGITQEDIARELGVTTQTIRNLKKLNTLSPELQQLIEDGQVKYTTALNVWGKLSNEEQREFIETVGRDHVSNLTAKETEKLIEKYNLLQKENEELRSQEPVEVYPDDYQYFKDSTEKLQKMVSELINKSEDYKYNLEKLEKEKNILERKARLNEEDSKKYKNLKDQIEKLSQQKDDLGRQIKARTELSGLVVRIEHLLKTELAPIKYSRAIHEASEDKIVVNNLRDIVGRVQDWCNEMSRYLPMKNYGEVIEVEVIEHE